MDRFIFEILDIKEFKDKEIEIIEVAGHTAGSLAFLYKEILFSGDTIFDIPGTVGRTDFKNSVPGKMRKSIKRLTDLKFNILCAGY